MKTLLLITSLLIGISSFEQVIQTRFIDSLEMASKLDSLKRTYPNIINPPQKYELAIYSAIEYYPELKNNTIKFKEKKIGTTLNARPTIPSLFFRRKSKRIYVVRVNNLVKRKEIITLNKVSFNAQVGILGHEFNHFLDYSERGFFGVMGRGFNYLSDKSKSNFEKEIDTRTLYRGLGWQLYDFSIYVYTNENVPKEYLEFKKKIYWGPDDFLRLIKESEEEPKLIKSN